MQRSKSAARVAALESPRYWWPGCCCIRSPLTRRRKDARACGSSRKERTVNALQRIAAAVGSPYSFRPAPPFPRPTPW